MAEISYYLISADNRTFITLQPGLHFERILNHPDTWIDVHEVINKTAATNYQERLRASSVNSYRRLTEDGYMTYFLGKK